MQKSNLLVILFVLVACTYAQNNSTSTNSSNANQYGSLTFEAPPDIVATNLFMLKNSSQDGKLIWSPKLEVLNLDLIPGSNMTNGSNSSVPSTNVSLSVYNRSAPTKKSVYSVELTGDWQHVESSVLDLSCNMLIEKNTKNMALLTWDRVNERFKLGGILPLSYFTSDQSVLSPSVDIPTTKALISQAMMVGSMCRVMTYVNGAIMAAFRVNAAWDNVHVIVLPTSWNVQTISVDLNYAIADNKIYVYDDTSFTYVSQYSLAFYAQTGNKYNIRNNGGRILVWIQNQISNTDLGGNFLISSIVQYFVFHHSGNSFDLIGAEGPLGHIEYQPTSASTFTILYSPQLTKIGFGISNGTWTNVKSKHIDYGQNKWFDLEFSEPLRYLTTVQHIRPDTELDFNDFFLVVRNATYAANPYDTSKPIVEDVYQMVSNNFTYLRGRQLAQDTTFIPGTSTTRQLGAFVKTFVDPSVTTSALVLNLYVSGSTDTYQLVEWDYGSIRSNRKVVKTPEPSYIYFKQPAPFYNSAASMDIYQWAWFQTVDASNSLLTVVSLDNNTNDHTSVQTYPIPSGTASLIYQNPECKLIAYIGGSNALSLNRELANGTYVEIANLRSLPNLPTVDANTIWQISQDCSRIRVNDKYYYSTGQGTFSQFTVSGNFTVDQVSKNITYATSSTGNLWKFDVLSGSLSELYVPPKRFPAGAVLLSAGNIIGLGRTTPTSAWFLGLQDNSGTIRRCINYSNTDFIEQPLLEASPLLTKVIMVGKASSPNNTRNGGGTIVRTDFYFINCPDFQNISLPNSYMQQPSKIKINLGEEMVHVLQLDNTGKPTKDVVYYLDKNTVALQAFQQSIVVPANTNWVRSQVYLDPVSLSNFLFSQYIWSDPSSSDIWRVVNVSEVNGQQAVFNNQNNGSFSATIVNGQVQICAPGCSDCECTTCLSGYALDTATSTCRKCAAGCSACSASDTTVCSACFKGTFLNTTNNCQLCDAICQTCTGSATGCQSCPPGQAYISGQCLQCPHNCFECSDAATCTTCNQGFVVTASNLCRGCSIKCAECNLYNITECTACSDGLFLNSNSQCQACPENCQSCGSASSCSLCEDGYSISATTSLCVGACQLPCLTCSDSDSSFCMSCPANSALSNGVCSPSFSCNSTQACTDCGYGLNYVYAPTSNGAVCAPCPDLSHCIQCDDVDNYECSICRNGYYVNDSGLCNACQSSCTSCWSDSICTGCAPGYTLKKGQAEGRCRACVSPCATCKGKTQYCTSCVAGFTRFGWKCRNNTGTAFTFVFSIAPSVILGDIDVLTCKILHVLKGITPTGTAECDQSEVTFSQIFQGSTTVSGTSSSGSSSNLASGSNSLGYTVVSSSVSTYGTTTEQSSNVGLIVGLVVGIVALVAVVVVIVYCLKKKASQSVSSIEQQNVIIDDTPEKNRLPEDSGFESMNNNPISQGAMVQKFE